MAIKESSKQCYNCKYYKALYVKGNIDFDRLTSGLCGKQNDKLIEDKHGCCENFEGNFRKIRIRKKAAIHKLLEMAASVVKISRIMEKEYNDKDFR